MAKKFIPDADLDFAGMARNFAHSIAKDPQRYCLTEDDAERISRVVQRYREALAKALAPGSRTQVTIRGKKDARTEAEEVIRKYGNMIRANDQISRADKLSVSVYNRPRKLRRRMCPHKAPVLKFVRGEGSVHMLEFRGAVHGGGKAKPFGAVRLELFVDLLEPGQPLPKEPGERPWYLRSFTTTPMRVHFPQPAEPRMVVYWARWADAKGEVSDWSQTTVARVEGWTMEGSAGAAGERELKVAA